MFMNRERFGSSTTGEGRVVRGGGWGNSAWQARAAFSAWGTPTNPGTSLGMRCAR